MNWIRSKKFRSHLNHSQTTSSDKRRRHFASLSQIRGTRVLKLRFESRTMNVNIMTGGALLSVSDPSSRFPNYIRQLVEIEGSNPDRKGLYLMTFGRGNWVWLNPSRLCCIYVCW